MPEKWIQWEPIQGLSPKYLVESLLSGTDEFQIILVDAYDREKKVQIIFETIVLSYRYIKASLDLSDNDLFDQASINVFSKWTFFQIENSAYVEWLSRQSYEISNFFPPKHFSFVTVDGVVDIISVYEPKVAITTKE